MSWAYEQQWTQFEPEHTYTWTTVNLFEYLKSVTNNGYHKGLVKKQWASLV